MIYDTARVERVGRTLGEAGLEGLIAALPAHVLMLTGYWPVVGKALAVVNRDGRVAIIAPEDERELAEGGWADEVHTFRPVSLSELRMLGESVSEALARASRSLDFDGARIGYEQGPVSEPTWYAAMSLYGAGIVEVLRLACPSADLIPTDEVFRRLVAVKTPREVARARVARRIAEQAFRCGAERLRSGLLQTEAASHFALPLSTVGTS